MSGRALGWARAQRTGSPSAKALLLVLADHANPQGECFALQATLAAETELSVRSVRNARDLLVARGLVTVERRDRQRGRGRRSDAYRLQLSTDTSDQPAPAADRTEDADDQPAPAADRSPPLSTDTSDQPAPAADRTEDADDQPAAAAARSTTNRQLVHDQPATAAARHRNQDLEATPPKAPPGDDGADQGDAGPTLDPRHEADRAYALIRQRIPTRTGARLERTSSAVRAHLITSLQRAIAAGWPTRKLVDQLIARELESAEDPAGALIYRCSPSRLGEPPPPTLRDHDPRRRAQIEDAQAAAANGPAAQAAREQLRARFARTNAPP